MRNGGGFGKYCVAIKHPVFLLTVLLFGDIYKPQEEQAGPFLLCSGGEKRRKTRSALGAQSFGGRS